MQRDWWDTLSIWQKKNNKKKQTNKELLSFQNNDFFMIKYHSNIMYYILIYLELANLVTQILTSA